MTDMNTTYNILIVDDVPNNIKILANILNCEEYKLFFATNGRNALDKIKNTSFDLILLDIMMPEMNGFEVCQQVKNNSETTDIPVIFITALSDTRDKVKGFATGGIDYITKPFQSEEVLARVDTHLQLRSVQKNLQANNVCLQNEIEERKRVEKHLEHSLIELSEEKQKSDNLLLNILPVKIAAELKNTAKIEPVYFDSASVMFTDFVDFTRIAEQISPRALIEELDYYFSFFDTVIEKYNLEKLKTIGDSYMCAGGIPTPNDTHAHDIVMAALEIQELFSRRQPRPTTSDPQSHHFDMRIGINSGSLIGGVIGKKKFVYDVWGDTVNIASRMESSGAPGRVNISPSTYLLVKDHFECEYRGKIIAKNKGRIAMYFVNAVRGN
jgi:DNA-binding response OmpR family regulator